MRMTALCAIYFLLISSTSSEAENFKIKLIDQEYTFVISQDYYYGGEMITDGDFDSDYFINSKNEIISFSLAMKESGIVSDCSSLNGSGTLRWRTVGSSLQKYLCQDQQTETLVLVSSVPCTDPKDTCQLTIMMAATRIDQNLARRLEKQLTQLSGR